MVLSRLGCSTVQLGIKVIDYFLGYRLPEYTFGKGALEKLPQILKEKDAGKVLVVTEAGLVELGFAKKLTDLLDEAGIEYAFYSGAEKNPTSNNVEDAFKIYRENGCRSVVALVEIERVRRVELPHRRRQAAEGRQRPPSPLS